MSKISIINNRAGLAIITVDGEAMSADLAGLVPPYVHALHFDTLTNLGEIEYVDQRPPVRLTDMTMITPALERFDQLVAQQAEQHASETAAREALLQSREHAKERIDLAAGRARARFIAVGTAIEQEYQLSLAQAQDFRSRHYVTPVPAAVRAHATAFDCSEQAAADAIIATAAQWVAVLEQIRMHRLIGKARVDQAPAAANFGAIAQPFIDALDAIKP